MIEGFKTIRDTSFFDTLIIGPEPEFLYEASHIKEEPVCILGYTIMYRLVYSSQVLPDCCY